MKMKLTAADILPIVEKKAPKIAPFIKRFFVEYLVPSNRSMGIRIDKISQDSKAVEIRLQNRRRNLNLSGSANGGVLMAFAECIHGIAVLWQFSPANHQMVTISSNMEYISPGYGELFSKYNLPSETINLIDEELTRTGVHIVRLSSTVVNKKGEKVAVLTNIYQIKRRRKVS